MGRYMLEHGQVMSYDHIGKISFGLNISQKIQYLGTNGHIQSGYRLIQNN